MKIIGRFLIWFFILALGGSGIFLIAAVAGAVTIDSKQTNVNAETGGVSFAAQSLSVNRTTGGLYVANVNRITIDLEYVRGGAGAATSVDMTCRGFRDEDLTEGNNYLPVLTSTSSAGISLSKEHTWRNPVDGGPDDEDGLANDESWVWSISDVPSPFMVCTFVGPGAVAGNDTLSAFVRFHTP